MPPARRAAAVDCGTIAAGMTKTGAPASTSSGSMLVARPVPTIACIDHSRALRKDVFERLVPALQRYVDAFVLPVWGTPARLVKADDFLDGAWALVFLDDADHLPYARHEVTPAGLPLAKVFVRTSEQDGFPVSLSASHELVEMLVDPSTNLMARRPGTRVMYSYEVADPVEDYHFDVDGFEMSDFVYPAYFEHFHPKGSVKFDYLDKVDEPFAIAPGGYQIVFADGKWTQEHGSPHKLERSANRDRRGRRGAQRTRSHEPH
jgi:hypothetical protein